jgi:predicted RNA binding protein with dsRBD fold (UPF0201 family)
VQISIRYPIYPTEDYDHLLGSMHVLFPSLHFDVSQEEQIRWVESIPSNESSLRALRETVHEMRVIDVVRKLLERSWTGFLFILKLDKQAALRGKLHFIDESDNPPLGAIEITALCESQEEYEVFKKWFTPPTKNGKVAKD